MHDSPTNLRRRLQKERSALNFGAQESAATAIIGQVLDSVPKITGVVAGYIAHGGEVNVEPTLAALADRGWKIVLPVCGADGHMDFCPWEQNETLVPNRYGIGEPSTSPIELTSIDVVLVPGVGFDRQGSRIGHGVGFYDRFFARCAATDHAPLRLGIAHDLQIVELPPPEPWDVPMDRVVTPTQVIDRTTCE